MKLYKAICLCWLILSGSSLYAQINTRYYPGSFALECEDTKNVLHLLPLSFYEFKDDIKELTLKADYLNSLQNIAPITFKNFKKEFTNLILVPEDLNIPVYERYDPLVSPPKGCRVITMAQSDDLRQNKLTINKKYWSHLSAGLQLYYLFEVYIQKYLALDLASVDYRRFSLYVATDEFTKFSVDQKISFLKYHGIYEYKYTGISINLNRDLLFFEDTKILKDAFPSVGALFEGAPLDQRKFISFGKDMSIFELATTTPFTRNINGQKFEFYIPEAERATSYPWDIRYSPRIRFYPNGNISSGYIKPIKFFYDLKLNIKDSIWNDSYKNEFFEVSFHPNQVPSEFTSFPGEVNILGKKYSVVTSLWWPNQKLEEVYFTDRHEFVIPKIGKIQALGLFFNEAGEIDSYL